MAFDVFMSYSHAGDGRLAPAVQRAMQQLAKPWYRVRALHVFRDETSLSANPHLWGSIRAAMDASEWFVLLASPDAACSDWVRRELEYWLESKPADRILVAVTDGSWGFSSERGLLDGTAVPDIVRDAFVEEPRHVDLRWARSETDLDLRNSRFRDAVAQLAAPVHGLRKDELESEDVRIARRARRFARGGVTTLVLLVLLSSGFAGIALQQRSRARREAEAARRQQRLAIEQRNRANEESQRAERALAVADAHQLVLQSADALTGGRTDLALLLAVAATHLDGSEGSYSALLRAVMDQPALTRTLHGLASAQTFAFSGNGALLAAGSSTGDLDVWNIRTGQRLSSFQFRAPFVIAGFVDGGRSIVVDLESDVTSHHMAEVFDVARGTVTESLTLPGEAFVAATAENAPTFLTQDYTRGEADVLDARTGRMRARLRYPPTPPLQPAPTVRIWALAPDGVDAASATLGDRVETQMWSAQTGESEGQGCAEAIGTFDFGAANNRSSIWTDGRMLRIEAPLAPMPAPAVAVLTCKLSPGAAPQLSIVRTTADRDIAGVTPDAGVLVTRDVGGNGDLRIEDTETHAQRGPLLHSPSNPYYMEGFLPVAFSPDGQWMTAAENDGLVRVWNVATLSSSISTRSRDAEPVAPFRFDYSTTTFSNDGGVAAITYSAIAGNRTVAELVRTVDHKVLFTAPDAIVATVSGDGDAAAFVTPSQIVVLDVGAGTVRAIPFPRLPCDGSTGAIAVRSRPAALAVICRGPALTWADLTTARVEFRQPTTLPFAGDVSIRFAPDGQSMIAQSTAANGQGALELMHIIGRQLVTGARIDGPNTVPFFTPDGRDMVFSHVGGIVRLAIANAKLVDLGLPDPGTPLAMSPDGKWLLSAQISSDSSIGTIWDLSTNEKVANFSVGIRTESIVRASLGRDAQSMSVTASVTTGDAQTQTLSDITYDLRAPSLERTACAVADRDLTTGEWAHYAPGVRPIRLC